MFQEASHFATGDVSQVNAKNYHTSTSNVVHDGGRYAPNIHINANKVYNHIEGWGSANLDASVKELCSHVAVGALYDSSERCDAPKCHFETRVAVQNDIFGWLTSGGTEPQPKRVLWLTGPAGAGKTAIMGSMAEKCQELGYLAASFFFSSFAKSSDRRDKRHFVSTLAYQFQQHPSLNPHLGQKILSTVNADPSIFEKRLSAQFYSLIMKPLQQCQQQLRRSSTPMVIIIDGLDECDVPEEDGLPATSDRQRPRPNPRLRADEQVEILEILLNAARNPAFPFDILVASRPEPWIRDFFTTRRADDVVEIFLDNKYNPDKDIALFFKAKFSEIRRRYRHLPATWPGEKVIATLIENASGQFIYAATVIRFIETPSDTPQVQLDIILKLRLHGVSNPLEVLDALYTQIIHSTPKPDLTFLWMKAYHIILGMWHGAPPASFFNGLCEASAGEAQLIFGALPSLIYAPSRGSSDIYLFYHKSLQDYLDDPLRSRAFSHIDNAVVHEWISQRIARSFLYKGPEVVSSDESASPLVDFIWDFMVLISGCIRNAPARNVFEHQDLVRCDADWWVGHDRTDSSTRSMIFVEVHRNCRFYSPCRPVCKNWRNALRRWGLHKLPHVPSGAVPLLLDRFCIRRLKGRRKLDLSA